MIPEKLLDLLKDSLLKHAHNGNVINWDNVIDGTIESCEDCDEQSEFCEGHVLRYESDTWKIRHDTNSNGIDIEGNPPLDIFTIDYVQEMVGRMNEDQL